MSDIYYEREYYDNGQISSEVPCKNGKAHGILRSWYENGQIRTESQWFEGKYHGTCKAWYESGEIKQISQFANGQGHGICTHFTKKGRAKISFYQNGKEVTTENGKEKILIEFFNPLEER